jgi:hypothetical protein
MSWLPPRRTGAQHQPGSPWRPPTLGRAKTDDLRYLIVEEIVGSSIGLALSPWPQTDSEGRLRFADDEALTFGVERDSFARYLAKHRRPRALRRRPLRIGDVFAVKVDQQVLRQVAGQLEEKTSLQPLLNPDSWLRSPVYDITADAREVAKASFYAAVTEPLNPMQAASIRELIDPQRAARGFSLPGRLRPSFGTPAGAIIGTTVLIFAGLGAGTALGRQTSGKHTVSVAAMTSTKVLTRTRFRTTTISKTITRAAQTTHVVVNHTTTETTPRQITLTVTLTGEAPGRVSVDPPGSQCTKTSATEQTCQYQLPAGTPVTLTATTSAVFGGWRIKDCDRTTCLVNPGESLAVTANFYQLK